jgi:hypothetical protein
MATTSRALVLNKKQNDVLVSLLNASADRCRGLISESQFDEIVAETLRDHEARKTLSAFQQTVDLATEDSQTTD